MAIKKISEFSELSSISDNDVLILERDNAGYSIKASNLKSYFGGGEGTSEPTGYIDKVTLTTANAEFIDMDGTIYPMWDFSSSPFVFDLSIIPSDLKINPNSATDYDPSKQSDEYYHVRLKINGMTHDLSTFLTGDTLDSSEDHLLVGDYFGGGFLIFFQLGVKIDSVTHSPTLGKYMMSRFTRLYGFDINENTDMEIEIYKFTNGESI